MARRVGIVGIGIMGTAMMRNLVRDGFEVVGYDVSEGAMGAPCRRPAGRRRLAARCRRKGRDPDQPSLPSVDAFDQVMTGQGGIASSNGKGQIVIECSTLPIEVKARGEAQLETQGKILLDCPVSGNRRPGSQEGPRRLRQR